jgi:glycosyltransferase involved in cell wall biosynthesis
MTSNSQIQSTTESVEVPLVTAIVLCYNHARFVAEALESVRLQTHPRIELIIVDDCSKDSSVKAIEEWILSHRVECVFLKHEKNQGVCASLNDALRHAKGKYVAAFAADDVWLCDKTEAQVSVLEGAPDRLGVVFSDAIQINESGERLPELFIAAHRPMPKIPSGRVFDELWEGNFIPAMTTMVRRECFLRVGNYDETLAYEDWDMWLRLGLDYEFCYCPAPLACYRLVSTSMVRTMMPRILESSARVNLKMLERRVLNASQRALAGIRLMRYAKSRYYDGLPGADQWLWRAMHYRFDFWGLFLLVCSTLKVPPIWVRRVQGFASQNSSAKLTALPS